MVGEITYFPETTFNSEEVSLSPLEQEADNHSSGMKEALRVLIRQMFAMETKFYESTNRVEIRVRPLAIYQEVTIPLKPKSTEE